ncbi:unnamed protein product [Ectocarpus sp. CCAP 1310/34]|nr:unnamed protein product [Ectocarpus sp. CCAP 1310/34]
MAASLSSLGPPHAGPGSTAPNIGFTVAATHNRRGVINKEPLSGNTLCHKNNVERKQAIHENRLASVKASLSLSTPRRMEFMDKRLSKNFHARRHHELVVLQNRKILRALEEIHSRSSTVAAVGATNPAEGGSMVVPASSDGERLGSSSAPASWKKSKGLPSASATNAGESSCSSKKLNSLLARRRNVKAALVARENQKMMERITRSKSLYSKENMRQHRVCHKRILRLRKTDYTAGHLLAAATASRHWRGGDSRDEEGRHRHRRRNRHSQRNRRVSGGSKEYVNATSTPPPVARGTSYSPTRGEHSRSVHRVDGGGLGGRGTKSAPRLPSLLDVEDIYGGGSILGSPNLEQCLQAAEMSARSGGGGGGVEEGSAVGGSGSRSSSRNSTAVSGNHEDDGCRPRPFTDGGVGSRGGSRHHRKTSRQRGGKDTAGVGGSSTGGRRGTDASLDALSHHRESLESSVEDSSGGIRRGRYGNQRGRGGGGSSGDKSSGSLASSGKSADDAELDKIYNPLAFLDETQGVRVLIQATKPLEVDGALLADWDRALKGWWLVVYRLRQLNHLSRGSFVTDDRKDVFLPPPWLPPKVSSRAGETWICFIRIMVQDPFDNQLDVRIIHDREEICQRLLSLEEATVICEHAKATSSGGGGMAPGDRPSLFAPRAAAAAPKRSLPLPGSAASGAAAAVPPSPTMAANPGGGGGGGDTASDVQRAEGVAEDGGGGGESGGGRQTRPFAGLKQYSASDENLSELLSALFKQADVEEKGFLTPEQLTSIMQNAELGLTGPELHLVIAEADENADGTIDYYEFIPLAYNLVDAFRARHRACEEMDEANLDLDQQLSAYNGDSLPKGNSRRVGYLKPLPLVLDLPPLPALRPIEDVWSMVQPLRHTKHKSTLRCSHPTHGILASRRDDRTTIHLVHFSFPRKAIHALYDAEFDRLVRQLKALCKSQDANGTGVLPRAEFKQCISADRCGGLTKIESKLLLNLLPKDSHGNVVYRKLGAGLEQVRFTTLRNTVAEASASDTQKYLMALCREEEAKSDPLGNKGHMKSNGDAVAIGGKHYSGVLRARQLTKLLLNAPLLSLSRLHVTALMSQANILDGMVNYVELVPMIAKTIEGMFHPWSIKMRHEIFNNNRGPGGGGGVGGGMGEGGSQQQQQGAGTATVRGKSRDDIQRKIVEILREVGR